MSTKLLYLLLFVCFAASLLSCMTSEGSLFEMVLEADIEPADVDPNEDGEDPPVEEEISGIEVSTSPSGADVYLNSGYVGTSPLLIEVETGSYSIRVEKDGYYGDSAWISYDSPDYVTISFNLIEITGYLYTRVTPSDAEIMLDGSPKSSGVSEIPIGWHTVRIRSFGYENREMKVYIEENKTTEIEIELEKAEFKVTELSFSRKTLNPRNPGLFGTTELSFEVTTFGDGEVFIYDADSQLVWHSEFPPFTSWRQSVVWNGRDERNILIPDGIYKAEVAAAGRDSGVEVRRTEYIQIDSTAVISYRSAFSGMSGLLFAPSPEVLPKNSFQLSALVVGFYDPTIPAGRFPAQVWARFNVLPRGEMVAQGTLILSSTNAVPYSASLGFKYQLVNRSDNKNVNVSLHAKGTYAGNTTADTQTNFTGLSAGASLMLSAGPLGLILSPEIIASLYKPTYTGIVSDKAFYIWGYAKSGLLFDFGSLSVGLSAAFRTRQLTESFTIQNPFEFPASAGIEVHWILPGTQFVITGALAGEYTSVDNYYFMGGAGVGLIN